MGLLILRPVTRLLTVLVLASVLWRATPTGASAPDPYRALLESYRNGDTAAAMGALAPMDEATVSREIRSLIAAEGHKQPRTWVQTAVALHLEYAMSLERRLDRQNFDRYGLNMDAAARLARVLYDPPRGRRPEGPGTDYAFLQAWFRFSAVHYQARGQASGRARRR